MYNNNNKNNNNNKKKKKTAGYAAYMKNAVETRGSQCHGDSTLLSD